MLKNFFTLPVSFTGFYTKDEPNFPLDGKTILFTGKGVWRRQGCEFRGLFTIQYLIKKSLTFQGPKPNSRTFQDD